MKPALYTLAAVALAYGGLWLACARVGRGAGEVVRSRQAIPRTVLRCERRIGQHYADLINPPALNEEHTL